MMFIKDWEIWLNYKSTIEKISKNDKISRLDFNPKLLPKPNIKSHFVHQSFENKKVNTFNKSEIKKFKSERFIDLHGYTREIDNVLENFCISCILKNFKFVTVITGKGSGIVREATEKWLVQHPEFIIAFIGIKDTMQQIGAYAVKLRTKKHT